MSRARRLTLLCLLLGGLSLCPSATATSGTAAVLHVRLDPLRLGGRTSISFEIRIGRQHGLPKRLTAFAISYPQELGIGLSGLGLAVCQPRVLQMLGPTACPNESIMGYGTAVAEVPYGTELLPERMHITILRGVTEQGLFRLLIYGSGSSPTIAQLTFAGQLAPASAPFGGQIQATLPTIAGLPGGAGAAVVKFGATIGPPHLRYHERVHGRFVSFHPRGILLPNRCPATGFRFAARLTFEAGSQLDVRTRVRCPGRRRSETGQRHAGAVVGGHTHRRSRTPLPAAIARELQTGNHATMNLVGAIS